MSVPPLTSPGAGSTPACCWSKRWAAFGHHSLAVFGHGPRVFGVGSIKNFDRCAERISHTAFGDDELRLGRISLDLAAQSQHLYINGAVVDLVVVHAAGFEQLIASEDSLRSRQ